MQRVARAIPLQFYAGNSSNLTVLEAVASDHLGRSFRAFRKTVEKHVMSTSPQYGTKRN